MDRPIEVVEGSVAETSGDETVRLDVVATTFAPDFMKLDIEGGEGVALRAAERVRGAPPSTLIEVHGPLPESECTPILRAQRLGGTGGCEHAQVASGPAADRPQWVACLLPVGSS
ncbi:MAG: hypothetical protein ACRD0Z_01335 [Acidimicrobiales bacterium]